jgi:hypothetical protein
VTTGLVLSRRRLLALGALLAVAAATALAVVDPFAGKAAPTAGVADNAAATALATVERRSLESQTQVSGTLGYAGAWTIAVPAGTALSALRQAQQQRATAQAGLATAQAASAADEQTLTQAQATLQAAQLKQAGDCAGTGAAATGGSGSGASGGAADAGACATAVQAVAAGRAAVAAARQKAAADGAQLAGARATLASAQTSLNDAQSSATPYGSSPSYTMLPAAGAIVRRGQALYAVDGEPALLLYGGTPAWRAFAPGIAPGHDVAELNENLAALGYGDASGDAFTSATGQAIAELQRAHGLAATGVLPLGSVVFEPGPVRVTAVTPTVGQAVQPGPIIAASSTRHEVAVQLDASQQAEVEVGDRVVVTLPDSSTTPGVVSVVGKVATAPSSDQSGNGGSSSPTIEVDVRLLHASAAGTLDQAPVDVGITTARVRDALVVPVNALVALAGGGYAVEEVGADRAHRLVPVTPGLFDDGLGLVQVSGSGLAAGQRVVVPGS